MILFFTQGIEEVEVNEMGFAITEEESGGKPLLLDESKYMVWSPSKKSWLPAPPGFTFATFLDAILIPDEEANRLMESSNELREPPV